MYIPSKTCRTTIANIADHTLLATLDKPKSPSRSRILLPKNTDTGAKIIRTVYEKIVENILFSLAISCILIVLKPKH